MTAFLKPVNSDDQALSSNNLIFLNLPIFTKVKLEIGKMYYF